MFLYDNKGDFIDVYKLEPKIDEIKKYRKKEMGRIHKKNRYWYAGTNDSGLKKLEVSDDVIEFVDLNVRGTRFGFDYFHEFYPFYSVNYSDKFLKKYLENNEFCYDLHRISGENDDIFILRLNKSYRYCRYDKVPYIMDGIIRIPKSLYLLELLLQGKTNLINNSDISEQLSLFDISYVDKIESSILKKICECEFIIDSYDSIMSKVEKNKDVINKVKVRVKK